MVLYIEHTIHLFGSPKYGLLLFTEDNTIWITRHEKTLYTSQNGGGVYNVVDVEDLVVKQLY